MSLEARALAFGFPGRRVGRVEAARFDPGEVTCLLGPNGGGKTTFLRTLLGLLAPLEGEVLLDGAPLASLSARQRARRIAYVPQATEASFDFTVAEMVEMGRTAHGGVFSSPTAADHAAARAALERLGIARLGVRPIRRVSGGERQLALIARALATDAPIVVMDEPTANLDFANQARVLREVARLREAGMTVLFSSHHPDHALRVADRVVLLRDGTVLAAGATDATVNSTNLSALYGCPVDVVALSSAPGPASRVCVARDTG